MSRNKKTPPLLPDIETKHLHVSQQRGGTSRQVDQPVQAGLHLCHALRLPLVGSLVALARGEGSYLPRALLQLADVEAPECGAGVAWGAGGEDLLEARGALVAEDARHPDPAQALPGVRVAGGPLGALQVTVTR